MDDIKTWQSSGTKWITLTQDVGGMEATTYPLRVRQFVYIEGDAHHRSWNVRGREIAHWCSPYAIANMTDAGVTIKGFVGDTNNIARFIEHYIGNSDKLLQQTYKMAYDQSFQAKVYSYPFNL